MKKLNDYCRNSTSIDGDTFIGFRFIDDLEIIFPIGYEISDNNDDCKSDIIYLLKSIQLSKSHDSYEFSLNGKLSNNLFPFESYLWIISDYLENGVYKRKLEKKIKGKNGKINWKRTLSERFYVSNNIPIYLNTIIEKSEKTNTMITQIYEYCLEQASIYLGWLFNGFKFYHSNNIMYSKSIMIQFLRDELEVTYEDKTKLLINHLLLIIENCNDNNESKVSHYSFGVNNYYYVWERMVDKFFSTENVFDFYPKSFWIVGGEKNASSSLRPDTIMRRKECIYILDSKYYKYGVSGVTIDLPNTSTIQKQIVYGDYTKSLYGDMSIYNAFILPYNQFHNPFDISGIINSYGYGISEWKEQSNKHNIIVLLLMDMTYLVNNWDKRSSELMQQVALTINEAVDDYKKINKYL